MGNEMSEEGGNVAVGTTSNLPTSTRPKVIDDNVTTTPAPTVVKPPQVERQVENAAGGYSFAVCDVNRLKRYLILGSEKNAYYSTPGQPSFLSKDQQAHRANIQCLQNLLQQKRHEEVLDIITQYSREGRVPREDPILTVLALCAGHEDNEIKKAALNRVVKICNIPTKLFRFLELTQDDIYRQREKNPIVPQKPKVNSKKRKKEKVLTSSMEVMTIGEGTKQPSENTDTSMEPCENNDTSMEPSQKKIKNDDSAGKAVPAKPAKKSKPQKVKEKKSMGWGRLRRKTISQFYVDPNKDACRLLYLMTKYKQRHNWSHKSVVSYCHPKVPKDQDDTAPKNLAIRYCLHGYEKIKGMCDDLRAKPGVDQNMCEIIDYIEQIEKVSKLSPDKEEDVKTMIDTLKTYGVRQNREDFADLLVMASGEGQVKENEEGKKSSIHIVREHLPTGFLKNVAVWKLLLADMPMTALIRNLGKMSNMNMFDDPENLRIAMTSMTNVKKLKAARIHPVKLLIAMHVYEKGHGELGNLTWTPNREIVKALDDAFYKSFKQPEMKETFKTGKNYMLCLDVSGSMSYGGCVGCEIITPAMASVAMAWVTWNVEDNVEVMAFGGHLEDMKDRGFTKEMRVNEAMRKTSQINFGATDCSLPMIHALQKRLEIDVFIVYTDSDTWAGRVQPVTALDNYNREMKRSAKLIVAGMQSNGFTIADPRSPDMMDIVGFDPNVPELISQFAKGELSGKCGGDCKECAFKGEIETMESS